MTKQTKDGTTLVEIIVWFLAGLLAAAWLGVVALVFVIYVSVTWPYYAVRFIARWD